MFEFVQIVVKEDKNTHTKKHIIQCEYDDNKDFKAMIQAIPTAEPLCQVLPTHPGKIQPGSGCVSLPGEWQGSCYVCWLVTIFLNFLP